MIDGAKLTRAMQARGLSAEDLEKLTGYDCGWIADLMEDQTWASAPTRRQIAKLAKAMNAEPFEIGAIPEFE